MQQPDLAVQQELEYLKTVLLREMESAEVLLISLATCDPRP